ncbi:FecR family protein [Flavobacterium hydatis]|uniref:Iron dicitrate transport regulator FecR n=1 Tax=Flavobacterium hydatis TaxID=991 RepID=A0A086A7D9_FLAHY|nr:FecR domain-containing protein [Flavobacterium hydatis]KFF12603.1 iron dicitrate transport regulator FecR [Flavobacterium hydatis]OXA92032.1 iron dicitrate transport regulator FecR [Flavobacterium hydatis]
MKSKRLKEEWNAIPNRGILPDQITSRMWDNIQKVTINKYKSFYNWVAAACAVIIMSFTGYQFFAPSHNNAIAITSTKTFSKDIRLICLPDGTRVWLNQNTLIEYPTEFAENERSVKLTGEAFFEVKRDVSRPFVITSGAIKTTVLGTSFNISSYANKEPEVNVRTGKVKVESNKDVVFLVRGDKAIYNNAAAKIEKQKTTLLEPEWKKVLIYVDGLTLAQVIEKLKLEHNFTVNYLDENLKNLKIQGTLDTRQGFYEMLQTIAFALEIKIRATDKDAYLISR